MKKRFVKRIVALTLVTAVIFVCNDSTEKGAFADNPSASVYSIDSEYISEAISHNYTKVSSKYTAKEYAGQDIITESGESIKRGDNISLSVSVPETAIYELVFEYASLDESILPAGIALTVDGDYPFYECRNIKLESTWVSPEKISYDRYGNEIVTVPDKLIRTEKKALTDGSNRYSGSLDMQLSKGTHEFSIEMREGEICLYSLSLVTPEKTEKYTGSQKAVGNSIVTIEAEDITYRNDSSVHAIAEYDTSLSPYAVKEKLLNTIDSDSFDKAGQTIEYEFIAPADGYYYIGMNYRQSEKTDFPVFLNIRIDGQLPNDAFVNYPMHYTSKYKTTTLTDNNGENLSVYLKEGTHRISFTISNDEIRQILEGLDEMMSLVNDLSLEITKVAGTNSDKYRDLKLSRYIPTLTDDLYGYAERLYALQETVRAYSDGKKTIAVLSPMNIAAKQLISLAKEPDEIPYRISELSSGSSSVCRQLANTVDNLLKNNIAIDKIFLYQESAELPKGYGFFKSLALNVERFISSFTNQEYSSSNVDKNHLQVWVNRSNQYVQIMQKMIDEYFTPQTGIEVDISLMSDQYKLVLSNTAGNQPDVATGINYTVPYELAIRGALVDMTQFEGFKETASVYEPGFFMTGTINDSVYSMPETLNPWVLFYRSDILTKLGLKVPNTMQDVIDMLPDLQMRGLNYYQPVSGMIAMRNFHGTTPLVKQYGGSLYFETAQEGTAFGEAEAIEGFTYLCDLFTIYDLPINIDNFYQHLRNGDIPIGVADFGVYNLMKNAAPELNGSWEIALVPGIEQEDGTIKRTVCGNAESCVIFKSNPEREQKAWEFIKWWSSTEIQAVFGQTLQTTYGDEYMWNSANIEAFAQLPWDSDDKAVIIEQMSYVEDMARVPGTYLLEREMSNAFNDIVVNGDTAQMRIDQAVKTINREIDRKLEEFGYIDSEGNTLEVYYIPTMERVLKILGRDE